MAADVAAALAAAGIDSGLTGASAAQIAEADALVADADAAAATLLALIPDDLPQPEANALKALTAASGATARHLAHLARMPSPLAANRPVRRVSQPVPQPALRSAPHWRDKARPATARRSQPAPARIVNTRVAVLLPRAA